MVVILFFCLQAEDGIRDLVRSRGLGDVYKRQVHNLKNISIDLPKGTFIVVTGLSGSGKSSLAFDTIHACLLYTSDAADERSSVDLGGRRIIKKKKKTELH